MIIGSEYKKAIVPYVMSSQIRQVFADIELYYSRIVTNPGLVSENKESPYDSEDASWYEPVQKIEEADTKYLSDLCEKEKINYVVLSKNVTNIEEAKNNNFELYQETENYLIFKTKD